MATITAAAGGGNWTVGATWVGGVAPTAADDVLLTVTSGNVTIDAGAVCRSLNCTGYVGTLTHTAAVTLTIGDGTAGASSVALKLVAGMTYTLGNAATSAIAFASTSVTQQTIATGGKALGNITLGSGASPPSYLLSDALTASTVTHSRGTFDTGNQTCTFSVFSSATAFARTVTLGSSAITLTLSGQALMTNVITNLTWTANTATITFSGANGSWFTTSLNANGSSIVFTGGGLMSLTGASGTFTCANLTVTGAANKTGLFSFGCVTTTMTGTLTITGQSATNRLLAQSNSLGSTRNVNAAVVALTNADFWDVNAGGAASPFTGTSLGDCQGNTNITFDVAATQTFAGGTKNWSDVTAWTSRVPLPQDNVVVATTTAGTLTADMPRLGKSIDFTGYTRAFAQTSLVTTLFGDLTFATGMSVSGTNAIRPAGRLSTQKITAAGLTFTFGFTVIAPGGTYTLQDNLVTSGTSALTLTNGTLDLNGKNTTFSQFLDGGGVTRTLVMGSGTMTLTSNGTVWNVTASMGITPGTATIDVTDTTASTKTFIGAGLTYPTLRHTATGAGGLTITGANTFTALDLECTTARTITLPAGAVQTVTRATAAGLTLKGASGQNLTLVSSTPGTAASIKASFWPMVTNPFVTPSTDVRLIHRQLRSGVTIQDPAFV